MKSLGWLHIITLLITQSLPSLADINEPSTPRSKDFALSQHLGKEAKFKDKVYAGVNKTITTVQGASDGIKNVGKLGNVHLNSIHKAKANNGGANVINRNRPKKSAASFLKSSFFVSLFATTLGAASITHF